MLKKLVSPAWAILEHGSYPFLLLVATPWFLHQLGTEHYGHWMLLTAVIGFGGVLNAGTGAATIKAVSAGIGREQVGYSGSIVNTSLAIAMLGGALIAVLVFATFWFGASAWLNRMGDADLIRLTGIAAAVIIWFEQLDNVFSSALKGAEQFGVAARLEIISKAGQVFAAAIVLYFAPTLIALYVTLIVIAIVRLFLKLIVTRRLLDLGTLRPALHDAKELLHFAKWGWLQGIGAMLFGVVDRMLVGSLLGATSLTYYSIASQLAMQIHAISAAGLSVIFPKVSRALEQGGGFSLSRLAKIAMLGNLLFSSALAATLYFIGPEFLRLWVGAEVAAPTAQILPWLVLAYWILALNTVSYYLLLGMGRIRFISITVLVAGAVAAITAYIAISIVGLNGAPAGRALYGVLCLVLAIPVLRQIRREGDAGVDTAVPESSPDSGRMV